MRAHEAKTCMCTLKRVHTQLCLLRMFLHKTLQKIVMIVHYYVMNLNLKLLKDPSYCCRDIRKITLNMHVRGINACAKF